MGKESENIMNQNNKEKFLSAGIYIVAMLAIIITPYIAKIIAPSFDYVGYGAMRGFFDELLTAILWVAEIAVLFVVNWRVFHLNIIKNVSAPKDILPIKRVFILSGIVLACVLVISIQIDFQVKPFYDLGEKFNGYELMNNLGVFIRNTAKCLWITIMVRFAQEFAEQVLNKKGSRIIFGGIILMLTLGIYDAVTGMNNLAVTYVFLNLVFGWIYLLTERNMRKSFLLILFVFFF